MSVQIIIILDMPSMIVFCFFTLHYCLNSRDFISSFQRRIQDVRISLNNFLVSRQSDISLVQHLACPTSNIDIFRYIYKLYIAIFCNIETSNLSLLYRENIRPHLEIRRFLLFRRYRTIWLYVTHVICFRQPFLILNFCLMLNDEAENLLSNLTSQPELVAYKLVVYEKL